MCVYDVWGHCMAAEQVGIEHATSRSLPSALSIAQPCHIMHQFSSVLFLSRPWSKGWPYHASVQLTKYKMVLYYSTKIPQIKLGFPRWTLGIHAAARYCRLPSLSPNQQHQSTKWIWYKNCIACITKKDFKVTSSGTNQHRFEPLSDLSINEQSTMITHYSLTAFPT